jgi:DNA-binding MarR family transcriptional regulator
VAVANDPGLIRLLEDVVRAMQRDTAEALDDRGIGELSPGRAGALLLVDRGGTRLTELARRAAVTKQAMMQMVDDLESLGSVRRVEDPGDGRAKVVRLTRKGLRQRAEARRAEALVEARVRRSLGDRRYQLLMSSLAELAGGEE